MRGRRGAATGARPRPQTFEARPRPLIRPSGTFSRKGRRGSPGVDTRRIDGARPLRAIAPLRPARRRRSHRFRRARFRRRGKQHGRNRNPGRRKIPDMPLGYLPPRPKGTRHRSTAIGRGRGEFRVSPDPGLPLRTRSHRPVRTSPASTRPCASAHTISTRHLRVGRFCFDAPAARRVSPPVPWPSDAPCFVTALPPRGDVVVSG